MATIINTLLSAATATGPGAAADLEATSYRHHTAIATVTGTVTAAEVAIEVSHDQANWAVADTIAFTAAGCKQVTITAPVRHMRANLTTLTGDPGAEVTASVSSG